MTIQTRDGTCLNRHLRDKFVITHFHEPKNLGNCRFSAWRSRPCSPWVWGDGVAASLPLGGADIHVLAVELVSLDQPEYLFDVPPDVRLVVAEVLQDSVRVDDGGPSEIMHGGAEVEALELRDPPAEITDQRNVDRAEAAELTISSDPRQVSADGVSGEPDNFGVDRLEAIRRIAECDDLRRADEREIERVREQHEPRPLELGERDIDELGRWRDCQAIEVCCRLANARNLNRGPSEARN
jgi:hypothetical protein